jgi:hypothetical protein
MQVHWYITTQQFILIYTYLTAVGLKPGGSSALHISLTPGGSSTSHTYTQTVHKTEKEKLKTAVRALSLTVIP